MTTSSNSSVSPIQCLNCKPICSFRGSEEKLAEWGYGFCHKSSLYRTLWILQAYEAMDVLPFAYYVQSIGNLWSYLSSIQLLEAIQLIWETWHLALCRGPSDGNKMALKAAFQTVPWQDSWWHGHNVRVLNEVGARLTCKGAETIRHRLHEIPVSRQPKYLKNKIIVK